jgi:hypothetical protein
MGSASFIALTAGVSYQRVRSPARAGEISRKQVRVARTNLSMGRILMKPGPKAERATAGKPAR